MSLRNSDCSQLTKLKADRNQAAFFTKARARQNVALTGTFVPTYNPQSGYYNASKITEITTGSQTVYYRANPNTVVSTPNLYTVDQVNQAVVNACECTLTLPSNGNSITNPISQPVNDFSPQ
jgi:hypothetical protein